MRNSIALTCIVLIVITLTLLTTHLTYALSLYCEHEVVTMFKKSSRNIYSLIMRKLNIKNATSALVLTNFKYTEVEGYDLYPLSWYFIVRGFIVPYNMVPIHSPVYAIPWIFAYNNSTKRAIFIELNRSCIRKTITDLCSHVINISEAAQGIVRKCIFKISVFNLNIGSLILKGLKKPSEMWTTLTHLLNKYAVFSIITLVTVWTHKAPPLLLLAAELHNHVCPGLLSGFIMYRYLMSRKLINYQDKIYIIASPVYCKDDVYVQLFDATPGKRRIVVKLLPWSEQDEISKILGGNVAGIVIVYNPVTDNGVAYILAFNWTKVHLFLRRYHTSFHGPSWWVSRLVADIFMLKYVNDPSYFVKILRIIHFKGHIWRYPSLFYRLGRAGIDPYVALGIIKPKNVSSRYVRKIAPEHFPIVEYVELAVIIILIIIIIILAIMYVRRRR